MGVGCDAFARVGAPSGDKGGTKGCQSGRKDGVASGRLSNGRQACSLACLEVSQTEPRPGRVFLRHAAVGNRVSAHWCGFTSLVPRSLKRAPRVSSPSQSQSFGQGGRSELLRIFHERSVASMTAQRKATKRNASCSQASANARKSSYARRLAAWHAKSSLSYAWLSKASSPSSPRARVRPSRTARLSSCRQRETARSIRDSWFVDRVRRSSRSGLYWVLKRRMAQWPR